MSVLYYLVRTRNNPSAHTIGDEYWRIGVEPKNTKDKDAVTNYLQQYFDDVQFIEVFDDVIYTDIDRAVGKGSRKIDGGGIIVSCKSLFRLTTKRESGNQQEWLRKWHDGLKAAVHARWKEKKAKKEKKGKSVPSISPMKNK